MGYEDLEDEKKLEEAINFVARGADLPDELSSFLRENELYDLIVQPVESKRWTRTLVQSPLP